MSHLARKNFDKATMMQFGATFRSARMRHNLSQEALAAAINTTARSISRWENGLAFPQTYYREQLIKYLNIPEESFSRTEELARLEQSTEMLWNVPYLRNPFFIGRDELLVQMHETFFAQKSICCLALSGMGGIGKTQIAMEYAYRFCKDYSSVIWINALTLETFHSDLVSLAPLLGLQTHEELDPAMQKWLSSHQSWLLILDNIEDLTLISSFLSAPTGHVLLTTRSPVTGTIAQNFVIPSLEPEEGTLFLLQRAKLLERTANLNDTNEAQRKNAFELVALLDGLPLALDQAGAYIEETGCSVASYLHYYLVQPSELLRRRGGISDSHPDSVATTLSLSIAQIESTCASATALLRLCSFLHPDMIPLELFSQGTTVGNQFLDLLMQDFFVLNSVIAQLRQNSLIQRNTLEDSISIPRLVQFLLKEKMDPHEQRQWAEYSVRLIHHIFPRSTDTFYWQRCHRYLLQALNSISLIDELHLTSLEAGSLLHHVGNFFRNRRAFDQAEPLLKKAVVLLIKTCGKAHIETKSAMKDLHYLRSFSGLVTRAKVSSI